MKQGLSILLPLIIFFLIDLYIFILSLRNKKTDASGSRYFRYFVTCVMISQGLTAMTYACDEKFITLNHGLQYALNYISLSCMALAAFAWFNYLCTTSQLYTKDFSKPIRLLFALPAITLILMGLVSPWTHWVMYIDADGVYRSGSLGFMQLMPYMYFLIAIAFSIVASHRGYSIGAFFRKFPLFMIPSLCGALINIAVIRGGYVQIGCSIGMILMYLEEYLVEVNENKRLRSVDALNKQLEEAAGEKEKQIKETSILNEKLVQQNNIVASAGLGIWYILLKDGSEPRMQPNEKMSKLLGIAGMNLSEEEIYRFWYDRILPEALDSVKNSVGKIISGVFDENTYQWNHPEKGIIYVRCGGNAVKLPDGTIVLSGYHADVTDIVSQEKKQQKELESAMLEARKANEAKSLFLSRMSHDIRTPLNGIIGLIDQLDRHPDDIQIMMEGKVKARTAANHLLSLVNDVLELSKLDDSNVKLAHEPFNILYLAKDVLTIASGSAAEYGVQMIHEDCSRELRHPYVYGSPLHVRQILLNIISNAAKYNHPGGSIYCRARMDASTDTTVTYTVEIEDTGIGMSPEFMEHMFEPFTQEHTDARSTFKGTGLGMSIVKKLIDKMNGTISVESTVGKGSKFTVSIPFEIADESAMPKQDNAGVRDVTGMKILLVEDNELNMEIAQSILEDFGTVVTKAENGQQAVDIFERNAPGTFDVILMDIMMPVLDGYGATRKIRQLNREDAKSIPIIAMTANAFDEDKQNAFAAGMNAHVAKPIEVPKLIEALAGIPKSV